MVKAMEDYKNQFVLILAGYQEEMEFFLRTNPGLPSRFPIQVDFPDYSVDQLMQIAELMVKERQYILIPQAEMKLRQHLVQEKLRMEDGFSNARYVRNTIEKAMRYQAVRLLQNPHGQTPLSKTELMTIKPEDLKWERKGSGN